jgi:GDSL-like Lipase/Acylhydrolase family
MRRLLASGLGSALIAASLLTGAAPAHTVEATRYLVVGDSISQGSSGDYTWRYRFRQWLTDSGTSAELVGTRTDLFNPVKQTTGSQYYADTSFADRDHSALWGDSYYMQRAKIADEVAASAPDVLVVQLGTNDLVFFTTPQDTIESLREFVAQARAINPALRFVLGEVPTRYDPWTDSYSLVDESADFNSRLAAFVGENSTESSPIVVGHTTVGWDPKIHTYDGTHPNPSGEAVIAGNMMRAVDELVHLPSLPSMPASYSWNVPGPRPCVRTYPGRAVLSWTREPTGSSGMLLRYRKSGGDWRELPSAVGSEDTYTFTHLSRGKRYDFALRPQKVFMDGVPGATVSVLIPTVMGYSRAASLCLANPFTSGTPVSAAQSDAELLAPIGWIAPSSIRVR